VHEAGHEPLQQLPLAEHELDLVTDASRDVLPALDRLRRSQQPDEKKRAAREESAGDRDQRGEPEGASEDVYALRTFLSSALIAGTISCRSPITA
jgi:hypothetical protein